MSSVAIQMEESGVIRIYVLARCGFITVFKKISVIFNWNDKGTSS